MAKSRPQAGVSDTERLQATLKCVRQNQLLGESDFLRFARKCGLPIHGVVRGDPGAFHRRGWLHGDGSRDDGEVLFHPFRVYVAHKILGTSNHELAHLREAASKWNRIVDLAVLLEPLYWPSITGKITWLGGISEDEHAHHMENFRPQALSLIRALKPQEWKALHEELRLDAASVDENTDLYMLLRVSSWAARDKLKGPVAAALWFRHMAELIRRAFEEVHGESWPEEDQAFGVWMKGARTLVYGSERPLERLAEVRHHVAVNFGLITGSVVRWYVEGDTEYHAILALLPEPDRFNIELVNLRGNLATGKGNIALKLKDELIHDRNLRRFSFISFDTDVQENVKLIRRQVEQGHVVGYIAAHQPDFEFANFDVNELVKVAAQLDEQSGFSGDSLRRADWNGICSGREFERRYQEISSLRRPLKGGEWGEALAQFASDNPNRGGDERPFWKELKAALRARRVKYNQHRQDYYFDTATFELLPKNNE